MCTAKAPRTFIQVSELALDIKAIVVVMGSFLNWLCDLWLNRLWMQVLDCIFVIFLAPFLKYRLHWPLHSAKTQFTRNRTVNVIAMKWIGVALCTNKSLHIDNMLYGISFIVTLLVFLQRDRARCYFCCHPERIERENSPVHGVLI